ncbi:MAG: response regulator [Candidatus Thiodiazotropha sp. (ex Lucina aurantia)]|uniref:Transcriptional regulatory protein QseB n=2 Tax=Candidatus Thiodiazotropha TaxID=1913444 RepID=A0A7Z0VIB1_9GAMM|nr:response regulator [Candidatus Thiodiazotropha endolucinida]MBT3014101.1 response regulator [Candidatus Thiodiazotropha sp. (ex Lucina pensylvanica)]MBT3018068.1 response regulator [Candidatus Thiodiazotropha taylori]MBT3041205.1 response regulator [Candidatus Thiodiazotropha sp. (ex Codakia orbicularis)]MBV2104281.1 response regulator [Candidatus Thiodiazotropha sp. (ex Lucina aurantia)]MBT3024536.1 response regulator [Candidatus Thiodiazotropha taylori]
MRILLAEDDRYLGEGLALGLKQLGHTVDWVMDGMAAEQALSTENLDVLILDLGLPRQDGLHVLQKLRKQGKDLPVLVLTARDAVEQRIEGLDSGADDYVVKPFDLLEVNARLRAITRRREGRSASVITYGDLVLDPAARSLTKAGEEIMLGASEFAVLESLLTHQGRILSRQVLEETLYGWDEGVESNAVEVYVHHLRKKLGKDLIRTVRGVGYTIQKLVHQ